MAAFKNRLNDGFDSSLHWLLRKAPLDVASAIGARLGMFAGRVTQKGLHRRTVANLPRLRPDLDDASLDALLWRRWRNLGRTMTEFGHLHRLIDAKRIEITGDPEGLAAYRTKGPRIVVGLHLGNWEALGPLTVSETGSVTAPYQPPPSEVRHKIAVTERRRYGADVHPPGRRSALAVARALSRGRTVVMYLDEVVDKRRRGPVWRGQPVAASNIHAVARLAVRFNATIIPIDCLRTEGAHFRAEIGQPIRPDASADADKEISRLAGALNAGACARIAAAPEQWLMLHERPPPG